VSRRIILSLTTAAALALALTVAGTPGASAADCPFTAFGPADQFGICNFDGAVSRNPSDPGATTDAFTQAGGHPYSLSIQIELNTATDSVNGPDWPIDPVKNLIVNSPPGLIGNPTVMAQCTMDQLADPNARPQCSPDSQVGVINIVTPLGQAFRFPAFPVFNMVPPPGVPARFSFNFGGTVISLDAEVRSGGDYGFTVAGHNTSEGLALAGVELTLWGVPADPIHTPERSCPGQTAAAQSGMTCPAGIEPQAFLTLPTSCTGPTTTTLQADSWFNPGVTHSDGTPDLSDPNWRQAAFTSHDPPGIADDPSPLHPLAPTFPGLAPAQWGPPQGNTGCAAVPFQPQISVAPTNRRADSPTGLTVDLKVPQQELGDPQALAQADLKDAVVKLPVGMSINAASADGLAGCSLAQIGLHSQNTEPTCPDNSKIGTVTIDTPLLDHPIEGAVYLAKQGENPFGSLFALYIVGDDHAQSGTVIKLAGEVQADPQTGQLTTTFTDQPQLPFEDLHLELFGGSRAALRTPPRCGTAATEVSLAPWSGNPPVNLSSKFQITEGPGGAPCPPNPAAFNPKLSAGTTNPLAGAFSPFVLRLTRDDGSQELKGLTTTLPEGLTGKLAGIPYCPDSVLAAIPTAEGTGTAQLAAPSCPAASQVGTVIAGAGAGPTPLYVDTGRAYLAGPYKGAPLSLAIVTPAIAGPFDLGNVVVRTALQVDPYTTEITAQTDSLPTILDGVPLDLRDVRVYLNRPDFTLNPTGCDAAQIGGTASGTEGSSAPISTPFQVAGCQNLGFKPTLKLSLKGKTKRSGHPSLRAVLTYPSKGAYSNIASAQVALPHAEFLDQGNLDKVCTQPQLRTHTCPAKSVYGHAKAWTPLLDKPLEGPVYLGVGFGYKLPALVAELDGQIRVLLKGKVDTTKKEGIRNTFEAVPDAPVSRFELSLKGGKKYGLLENSENICRKTQKADARFAAHSGKVLEMAPVIANDCGKKKGQKRGHKGGKGKPHHGGR
jgi:hypothetical protein